MSARWSIRLLAGVPTFAIVNSDESVIPLTIVSGSRDLCWFTDAAEAAQLLERTLAANPDAKGIHLAVVPLGEVFGLCGGWAGIDGEAESEPPSQYIGGVLRVRGPRKAVDASTTALREQLAAQGLAAGEWVVPVYCSDEFQTEGVIMPLFFSAEDLQAGWMRAGKDAEAAPKDLAVMELRVLVHQMLNTDVFDWSLFQFVSSSRAYEMATELQAEAKAKAAGAATEES